MGVAVRSRNSLARLLLILGTPLRAPSRWPPILPPVPPGASPPPGPCPLELQVSPPLPLSSWLTLPCFLLLKVPPGSAAQAEFSADLLSPPSSGKPSDPSPELQSLWEAWGQTHHEEFLKSSESWSPKPSRKSSKPFCFKKSTNNLK